MEGLLPIIIQLVVGALGGNVGGALMKNASLGPLGNSIAGAIGGVGGGSILGSLLSAGAAAAATGGFDIGTLAGSGIGGLVLTVIAGLIKNAMRKA